ncbi:MAG TPA: LytR C-terminal domain-containing protein [Gaiellaceae bacterium]|jgi:transcriptional regulator with XRE-family HTH domain|nr:LytR C-terminal domain-containing protein [Gaiellaceae bacterium]
MNVAMLELAHPLDAIPEPSPLKHARERRELTTRAIALRTGLTEQEVEWLEEGRIYRFPSQNDAIMAAVVYATALGIDKAEARKLAGLPVGRTIGVNAKARLIAVGLVAALLSALAVMVVAPNMQLTRTRIRTVEAIPNANLPAPWKLQINVENGNGDIAWTRSVASRVGAMGYTISKVGRADRFNYQQTTVFYGPGAQAVGLRLARQLDVGTAPTPGLKRNQLLVIVGPKTVAAQQ